MVSSSSKKRKAQAASASSSSKKQHSHSSSSSSAHHLAFLTYLYEDGRRAETSLKFLTLLDRYTETDRRTGRVIASLAPGVYFWTYSDKADKEEVVPAFALRFAPVQASSSSSVSSVASPAFTAKANFELAKKMIKEEETQHIQQHGAYWVNEPEVDQAAPLQDEDDFDFGLGFEDMESDSVHYSPSTQQGSASLAAASEEEEAEAEVTVVSPAPSSPSYLPSSYFDYNTEGACSPMSVSSTELEQSHSSCINYSFYTTSCQEDSHQSCSQKYEVVNEDMMAVYNMLASGFF